MKRKLALETEPCATLPDKDLDQLAVIRERLSSKPAMISVRSIESTEEAKSARAMPSQ